MKNCFATLTLALLANAGLAIEVQGYSWTIRPGLPGRFAP